MKILIVEDFNVTRKMQIKSLYKLGFSNVLEAEDGLDAVNILSEDKDIQLIISDWNMPNKNGYELLKWVRSDAGHKNTPFIMATAQAEKKESKRATEAGVSNFITKPFTPEELGDVIRQTFEKTKAAPAETASRLTGSGKLRLRVAHIQITDHLVLGILKYFIDSGSLKPKHFDLETVCMKGWNPVQKALETGEVDGAFVLAPIAMDVFSAGAPIRMVLFSHKNGSICVKRKGQTSSESMLRESFMNKVFYLPHVLSVHHMLSDMFFRELGITPGLIGKSSLDIAYEVIPPVQMPTFLGNTPEACGFMVAQPIGKKAIAEGGADLLFLSGELWENHPCCVTAFRKDVIDKYEDAIYEFTEMMVQAGSFIESYPDTSSRIAVGFLDPEKKLKLNESVLESVLSEVYGIKTDDLYPVIEDLDIMQRYMNEKLKIGNIIDLEKFVDIRFAEKACQQGSYDRHLSTMNDASKIIDRLISG